MLVRALANISLCHVPGHGVLFTTMERGNYLVPEGPELAAQVVERLEPLATSTLVIDNEFRTDLEPELWHGDELTREIAEVGQRLDALGLLPAPFPVEDLVSERDLRAIMRLYAIGGLSYGNLSAAQGRRPVLDERERRRQGEPPSSRGATSSSSRATTPTAGRSSSACRPTSSRGASRSTRSSTG